MAETSGLQLRVSEVGLDETAFWLSKLADLGVKSLASLKHIERDIEAYNLLAAHAKYNVEKKALLELLKLNESDAQKESVSSEITKVIEEIQSWNIDKIETAEEIEKKLQYLIEFKNKKLADPQVWLNDVILHSSFQEFLTVAMNYDSSTLGIKSLMQTLIDLEIFDSIDQQSFPQMTLMQKWLYEPIKLFNVKDITDFSSFNDFLINSIERVRIQRELISPNDLAKSISEGLYHFRLHIKETYDDVFIISLVHPFVQRSYHPVISLNPLKIEELEFLQEILSEQREILDDYKSRKHLLLQSYLLLLALHSCYKDNHRQKVVFIKQVCQMMRDLDPPLENDLLELLNQYFKGICIDNLIESLKANLQPPCKGRLKNLLQNPIDIDSNQTVCNYFLIEVGERLSTLSYQEDDFFVLHKNVAAHDILEKLELCKYYPKKLKLSDALCIREEPLILSLNENLATNPGQLPFLILHKLMSYDCLCRSDLMPIVLSSEENEFDDLEEEVCLPSTSDASRSGIHPVDSLLSLLLCSDDFLCQDLFSRLAKCQLAIPLIFTDPFNGNLIIPLWAMCSIIKEWTVVDDNGKTMHKTSPIVNYPMPVITFIRIGLHLKNNLSKSKILNDVVSDAHHDYFFHRDCRGGQYKSFLGKGLVDMCWYLPSGKPADNFPDAVTFVNLHGDARDYPQQCRFLSKISSMCVALISEIDPQIDEDFTSCLMEFNSSSGGIFFMNGTEKSLKSIKSVFNNAPVTNLITRAKTKTAAEIKDTLRSKIKLKILEMSDCRSIRDLCHNHKGSQITIDEDSTTFQKGLAHVNKITDIILKYGNKKPSAKEIMLPLQGESLWQAWASNDKEIHRQMMKGSESIQEYTAKIERKKTILRTGQLEHVKNLTPIMKLFIEFLVNLQKDKMENLRNHFLQRLKLELNSISRDTISDKQHEYQKTRKILSKLQAENLPEKNELKEEVVKLKKVLEELQEDIIDSSFGLEHLLRELGQVYEASVHGKLNEDTTSHDILDSYISSLPRAAAELLIEGYPLELMDGDAAHVPLEWVVAVIKEAAVLLEDPKVFVLSVLGLQSTGKSTMLNTTFGLQFNVSAGRCTRGAFMQLLPLDQELKNKTKCSYVIIVDTEGLRAPELDPLKTQKHDNELATFVIGLANMTLINIYGEVPGDIDDILQTSVHAFLRMNKVRYYPSCQFVHQNAGVNIKGEVSRAKFTQKLNRFTTDAAREEHCEGQFETFNDVIRFNDQTDVHYFPGLWKGDPPMAPVNEGYSQLAQNLKNQFVQIICKRASISTTEESIGDLDLSSFHVKIKDLWDTLLKEKFVFSFKNTLEITAYNALEAAYSSWDWRFQSAMLEWEQKAENEISTESLQTLTEKVQLKLKELNIYVEKSLYEPVKKEMEAFFNGKQSEILVQWKAKFEIRLELLSKEVRLHAEDHCNSLLKARQAINEFETDRQANVEFIKKKVQEHIELVRKEQEELNESLEKKELNPEQIKTLLARNLFNTKQLNKFIKDQTLTVEQVIKIKSMMNSNKGKLNEAILEEILKQEILTLDQFKNVLKRTQQTEDQLKHKFDEIWDELMKQLPHVTMIDGGKAVELKVEKALTKFMEGKGHYQGELIAKLQKASLRQRGIKLDLKIKEKHFMINSGVVQNVVHVYRRIRGTTDQYQIQAMDITNKVFDIAIDYLEKTKKKNTDFKAAFIAELLRSVDVAITKFSDPTICSITVTPAYRLDVYVTICGYACLQFEAMAKKFEERNNPVVYLEKHQKIPLFTKFKNQYKLTEAEEAIADTLCAYLKEPIQSQIEKSMGAKMVNKMKSSKHHYFANKMALKVKILADLHEEKKFENFMLYVNDVKKCLKNRIRQYTIKYCDEKVSRTHNKTQLQIAAEDEVNRLITVIEDITSQVQESNIHEWLVTFCNDTTLRQELGADLGVDDLLVGFDSLQDLNVNNFKSNFLKELQSLKKKFIESFNNMECEALMHNWKDQPHNLLKGLIGCTEQCPFCKEQCDLLDHDDTCDHRTEVHRISCLAGWRNSSTQAMTIDICPSKVADEERTFRKSDGEYHHYKDYKTVYPKWFIPPDKSAKSCSYWKWFVGKYQQKLVQEFDANASEVPAEWAKFKWPSIKQDLKSAYNVEF